MRAPRNALTTRESQDTNASYAFLEHLVYGRRYGAPAAFLFGQLIAAGSRDFIQPRPPLVLRGHPLCLNPALLLHAVQSRIQRTLLHPQDLLRDVFDVGRDAIAMERAAPQKDLQNEQRERTLQSVLPIHIEILLRCLSEFKPVRLDLLFPAPCCYGWLRMSTPVLSREEELYWLALKLVPGLGTRTSGKLLDRFRTPQAIFRASRTELEAAGVSGAVAQSIASGCTFEDAAAQQEKMAEAGAVLVTMRRSALSRSCCARSSIRRSCCSRAAASNCLQSLTLAWWARAVPRPMAWRWPSGFRPTWRTPA